MLSSDYETKVTINKRELLSCIDRATLLVKEGDKKPIIINITDGLMEIFAFNQSGYNGCLIKFKHNLIVGKEQGYIFFCFTGKNLAKEVIRQTIFSIADNDNNRLMTGELFEINGDELKVDCR